MVRIRTLAGLTVALAITTMILACRDHQSPAEAGRSPEMREKMRQAYGDTADLFTYVWAPEMFKDPAHEKAILSALDRLIEEFHDVEAIAPAAATEPGFKVTLLTHEEVLRDIRRRFVAGQKDYANWRLRALTANCISCHSRYEVASDFLGEMPVTPSSSFEAKLAGAEFLFAARQFEKASAELFKLAEQTSASPAGEADAIEALKLWLVVEVRVKDRPDEAADQLERLLADRPELVKKRPVAKVWVKELREIVEQDSDANPLIAAEELLRPVAKTTTIDEDEAHLVKTLQATALLHSFLQTAEGDSRREAFFLLALGYQKIPIPSLELYQEMYLEQCIREFPGTTEAKKAYSLLEELIEFESTGSGGLNLDPQDTEKLRRLRNLAHGTESEEGASARG